MKILTCTCCGAEITAPQFYNGKPYGWTCIKKFAPEQKQIKRKYVPVVMIKDQGKNYYGGIDAIIEIGGVKKAVRAMPHVLIEQNGNWFAADNIFKR